MTIKSIKEPALFYFYTGQKSLKSHLFQADMPVVQVERRLVREAQASHAIGLSRHDGHVLVDMGYDISLTNSNQMNMGYTPDDDAEVFWYETTFGLDLLTLNLREWV